MLDINFTAVAVALCHSQVARYLLMMVRLGVLAIVVAPVGAGILLQIRQLGQLLIEFVLSLLQLVFKTRTGKYRLRSGRWRMRHGFELPVCLNDKISVNI